MILTGKKASHIINGEIQPHGIDIKVTNVYYLINKDINAKVTDDDYIPLEKFREDNKYYWELCPQQAVLFELEIVDLSKENLDSPVVGFVLPKSRFLRRGITINSALWDMGFKGKGKVLVVNHSERIQKIYEGMYFGQIIFLEGQKGDQIYAGTHQGEGL